MVFTSPVISAIQGAKVGLDSRFDLYDDQGRSLGAVRGSRYGRGGGLEVMDPSGLVMLRIHRSGLTHQQSRISYANDVEVGTIVMRKRLLRRPTWTIVNGQTRVAEIRLSGWRQEVHAIVRSVSGNVLARIDGAPSTVLVFVDSNSRYSLTRLSAVDQGTAALLVASVFVVDASVRSLRKSPTPFS